MIHGINDAATVTRTAPWLSIVMSTTATALFSADFRNHHQKQGTSEHSLSPMVIPSSSSFPLLGPDLKQRVPRTSTESIALGIDTKAGDTVVMRLWKLEGVEATVTECVPGVAVEIVVASEQETAGSAKVDGGDAA